jgi:hypothetical protein
MEEEMFVREKVEGGRGGAEVRGRTEMKVCTRAWGCNRADQRPLSRKAPRKVKKIEYNLKPARRTEKNCIHAYRQHFLQKKKNSTTQARVDTWCGVS